MSLVLILKYRLTKLSPSFWITLYYKFMRRYFGFMSYDRKLTCNMASSWQLLELPLGHPVLGLSRVLTRRPTYAPTHTYYPHEVTPWNWRLYTSITTKACLFLFVNTCLNIKSVAIKYSTKSKKDTLLPGGLPEYWATSGVQAEVFVSSSTPSQILRKALMSDSGNGSLP